MWCWHIHLFGCCFFFFDMLIFTKLNSLQYILLDQIPAMPKDFPCTHPGCHRTFKQPSNWTQHYNAHHHPLSPDSEPDPAHQFHIKYHPKLHGMYSCLFVEDSSLIAFYSFALRQEWKFSAWAYLTTAPWHTLCNSRCHLHHVFATVAMGHLDQLP